MIYKCDYCGGTFEHPDAVASKEGYAIACDDCWQCFKKGICYKCGRPNFPGCLACEEHLVD